MADPNFQYQKPHPAQVLMQKMLFAEYSPQGRARLSQIPVDYRPAQPGFEQNSLGAYYNNENRIWLSNHPEYSGQIDNTLRHELNHAYDRDWRSSDALSRHVEAMQAGSFYGGPVPPLPYFWGMFGNSTEATGGWGGPSEYYAAVGEQGVDNIYPTSLRRYYPQFAEERQSYRVPQQLYTGVPLPRQTPIPTPTQMYYPTPGPTPTASGRIAPRQVPPAPRRYVAY